MSANAPNYEHTMLKIQFHCSPHGINIACMSCAGRRSLHTKQTLGFTKHAQHKMTGLPCQSTLAISQYMHSSFILGQCNRANKQTNKQTNKQASKQANKQTNKHKQTNQQTNKPTNQQTNKPTNQQTNKPTKTNKQADARTRTKPSFPCFLFELEVQLRCPPLSAGAAGPGRPVAEDAINLIAGLLLTFLARKIVVASPEETRNQVSKCALAGIRLNG